jgi:hypothetical integral membrane protein (TIGR02206 family)
MTTEFTLFGKEHLLWLGLGTISTFWLLRKALKGDDTIKSRLTNWLSFITPMVYLVPTLFIAPLSGWDLNLIIPLHLCYFLTLMSPWLLRTRNHRFYAVSYFWVMAGCSQSLITPDVSGEFPSLISIRYWLSHTALLQCFLFAAVVYKMRPRMNDIWKSLLWFNVYLVIVGLLNYPLDTNFLYLREKPPVPTMLDHLGEFPWFLLTGQIVALALFFIVYLPYWIGDLKKAKVSV